MRGLLAIAIGGTLGCWARYGMTILVQAIYGRDFPYATLSINVLGAFLMGFLFHRNSRAVDRRCLGAAWNPHRLPRRFHHLLDLRDGIPASCGARGSREERPLCPPLGRSWTDGGCGRRLHCP
jgi:hypothetical protein